MAGCICRNMFVNVPAILFILSGLILATTMEPVHAAEEGNKLVARSPPVGRGLVLATTMEPVHAAEEGNKVVARSPPVGRVCPLFCLVDVIYSTCKHGKKWKRGKKVLKSYCNCCLLKIDHPHAKGCKLHLTSGKVIRCS